MLKKIFTTLSYILLASTCFAFPTHTNKQSFVVTNSVSSDNSAFYWTWNNWDDQVIDVDFDVGGTTNIMFRMAKPRRGISYVNIYGGVVTLSGNSLTYWANVARTNIPPPATYDASFMVYESDGGTVTASRVLATGKVKTEYSIHNISNAASWTPVNITYQIPTNVSLTESDPIWAATSNTYLPLDGHLNMESNLDFGGFSGTNVDEILFEDGGFINETNYSGVGTNVVYINDEGQMGIQTTNITEDLTVNGGITADFITNTTYYGDGSGLTNIPGATGTLLTNTVHTGDVAGIWNDLQLQLNVVGSNELDNTFIDSRYLQLSGTNNLWTAITNNEAMNALTSNSSARVADFNSSTNYLNGAIVTNAANINTLSNYVVASDSDLEAQINALSNATPSDVDYAATTNLLWGYAETNRALIVLTSNSLQAAVNTNAHSIQINSNNIESIRSATNDYHNAATGAVYKATYLVDTGNLWGAIAASSNSLRAGINTNMHWIGVASNALTAEDNTNIYWLGVASNALHQEILDNTETDPVWTDASSNYYTKTGADARFLTANTGRFDQIVVAENSATGSELVVNGVFTNAPLNWTLSGTASNHADRIQVGSGVGGIAPSNGLSLTTGGVYYVTFEKGSNGTVTIHLGGDTRTFSQSYAGTNAAYMGASLAHSNLYVELDGNGSWEYLDTLSIRQITNGNTYVAGTIYGDLVGNASIAEVDPVWFSVSNAYWTSNQVANRIKYQKDIITAYTNDTSASIASLAEAAWYKPGGITWDDGLKYDATANNASYTSSAATVIGKMYKFQIFVDNAASNRDMVVSVGGNTNTYPDVSNGVHYAYIGANTTNGPTLGCLAGVTGWRITNAVISTVTNGDTFAANDMTVGGRFSAGYISGDAGGMTNLIEGDPIYTNDLATVININNILATNFISTNILRGVFVSGTSSATNTDCHAVGNGTLAGGLWSSSEGGSTEAHGLAAHAEGFDSEANGNISHAEGNTTEARGESSHSEGEFTLAAGKASHAAGSNALATNDYTFVWSDGTTFGSPTTGTFSVYASNGIHLAGGPICGNGSGITNLTGLEPTSFFSIMATNIKANIPDAGSSFTNVLQTNSFNSVVQQVGTNFLSATTGGVVTVLSGGNGRYRVDGSFTITGFAGTLECYLTINNVQYKLVGFDRKNANDADVGAAPISGCVDLSEGDEITVEFAEDGASDELELDHYNWSLDRKGL